MSDVSQGPGWWLASDGKWYPPQAPQPLPGGFHPSPQFTPPPPGRSSLATALIITGSVLGVLLIVVLAVVMAVRQTPDDDPVASPAACKDTPADQALDTQVVGLYKSRLGVESANDHEAVVGDCVRISGLTGYVTAVESVVDSSGDPMIRVAVRVENRDSAGQYVGKFDWKLQQPNGQLLDPTFDPDATQEIDGGEIVSGGQVEGTVSFSLPLGDYYVVWEPALFSEERGIWKIVERLSG